MKIPKGLKLLHFLNLALEAIGRFLESAASAGKKVAKGVTNQELKAIQAETDAIEKRVKGKLKKASKSRKSRK
jgi:hypothetical protein